MNVADLIDILSKEVKPEDRKNANIEIWCGDQEYEIESMGGFSLSPDITVQIKKIKTSVIKPMVFKKEHEKMVSKTIQKISKDLKGKTHVNS